MREKTELLLLNPPFFRACNSHNDRVSLSLCYLSSILEKRGIRHVVYNADFKGSDTYSTIKHLFDNFESFIETVDNRGIIYDEVVEKVLSFRPKAVLILGAEPLVPTKDTGSPYIAANFSKRLRDLGIYTIGLGPYFSLEPEKFRKSFDCIMEGEPSETILSILKERPRGVIKGRPLPLDILPSFSHLFPEGQRCDSLMTSFGCFNKCSFCVAGELYRRTGTGIRHVKRETVSKDIAGRKEKILYIQDLNFSAKTVEQLALLSDTLKELPKKQFTAESTVKDISEEKLKLFRSIGVSTLKIGIEGMTDRLTRRFNKRQSIKEIQNAVEMLRKYDMKFIAYLLIGGVKEKREYLETMRLLKRLRPDHVVVSIWAYRRGRDYRYDTQFSPVTLKNWGIRKEVFYDLLSMQNSINPTVGTIVDDENTAV